VNRACAVRQVNVDPLGGFDKGRHLAASIERHGEFRDPVGETALDFFLPEPERVVVATRSVASLEDDARERDRVVLGPLRKEPFCYASLIEKLDRPWMQTARARALHVLVRTPLDDRGVHAGHGQLPGQHQSSWTAADDDHVMFRHLPPPIR
jgi:hypothetical protein